MGIVIFVVLMISSSLTKLISEHYSETATSKCCIADIIEVLIDSCTSYIVVTHEVHISRQAILKNFCTCSDSL